MMPMPRLKSASVMSISRSTARSTELMSAEVIVARSESSGFTSESASPTTRATWLFLFCSARVMAPLQVLLLDGAGELRRELPGGRLAPHDADELGDRDGQRQERHESQDDHDALGEGSGRSPQVQQIYIHLNDSSWR
jgi:hypothetical protein